VGYSLRNLITDSDSRKVSVTEMNQLVTEYLKLKAQIEMLEEALKVLQEDILTDPDADYSTDPRIRIQNSKRVTVTIKPELRKLIPHEHYVALSQFRTDKEVLPVLEIVAQLLPADIDPHAYYSVSERTSTFIVRTRNAAAKSATDGETNGISTAA
jgi:hypothetical protein